MLSHKTLVELLQKLKYQNRLPIRLFIFGVTGNDLKGTKYHITTHRLQKNCILIRLSNKEIHLYQILLFFSPSILKILGCL